MFWLVGFTFTLLISYLEVKLLLAYALDSYSKYLYETCNRAKDSWCIIIWIDAWLISNLIEVYGYSMFIISLDCSVLGQLTDQNDHTGFHKIGTGWFCLWWHNTTGTNQTYGRLITGLIQLHKFARTHTTCTPNQPTLLYCVIVIFIHWNKLSNQQQQQQ